MQPSNDPESFPRLLLSSDHRALGRQRRPSDDPERIRIRRGVHASRDDWQAASPTQRHRARIHAIAATRRVSAVFSHTSAAVLHGLPLLDHPGDMVHAITEPTVRRRASGIAWHRRHLDPSDVAVREGLPVTSLEVTLMDLARSESFASAVVSLDAALADPGWRPRWDAACGRVARRRLEQLLDSAAGAAGSRRAREALRFADGRAERAGESLSRIQMFAWDLPAPDLQVAVACPSGRTRRVDFLWRDAALIGEFDGRVKYSRRHRDAGEIIADVVWEEKRREDDLRSTGYSVARWLWSDASSGVELVRMLNQHGITTNRRIPRPVFTKGTR